MKRNKNTKSSVSTAIIISLAYIILGLIMIFVPDSVSNFLSYALGIAVTVYGLFNIISFFLNKTINLFFELIVGVIATAFGIFTLFSPSSIIKIIFVTIGIIIIIDSLLDIKHSFNLKALGMKNWWVCTALSTAVIILGLSTILFPAFFGDFLIILLGLTLIYEGISGFFIVGFAGHYSKKSSKNRRMIDTEATDID